MNSRPVYAHEFTRQYTLRYQNSTSLHTLPQTTSAPQACSKDRLIQFTERERNTRIKFITIIFSLCRRRRDALSILLPISECSCFHYLFNLMDVSRLQISKIARLSLSLFPPFAACSAILTLSSAAWIANLFLFRNIFFPRRAAPLFLF